MILSIPLLVSLLSSTFKKCLRQKTLHRKCNRDNILKLRKQEYSDQHYSHPPVKRWTQFEMLNFVLSEGYFHPYDGYYIAAASFILFFFRPVYNSSFSPPYRGIYTILFDTRCYNGFFALDARKIHYSAPRDIIHVDYYTAAVLHYTYMY